MTIALPPLDIRYVFDRTGQSRDNFVSGETHTLPPVNNRIIVPRNGAFYSNSLIVRQGQKTLVLGVDYELASLYQDATEETGLPVHVMIYFVNLDIVGEVTISYQVVGGKFTGTFESIQSYVNALLVDPRAVHWDDIINRPEFYVPADHFHDINDIYGLNEVIPELQEIARNILRVRSTEMRRVYTQIMTVSGQSQQLATELRTELAKGLQRITEASGNLNAFRSQLTDMAARVSTLENSTAVKDLRKILDTKVKEINNDIATLDTRKATKQEVQAKYDELINKFNEYFENGKLKDKYIKLSEDKHNRLVMLDDGLSTKRYLPSNKVRGRQYHIHVDATDGNDETGDGSAKKPYQTVLKAITSRIDYSFNGIQLKEGQRHILPANQDAILIGGVCNFYRWGKTEGVSKPVLQFGDNLRTSIVNGANKSNNCLWINDLSLTFYAIDVILNLDESVSSAWWGCAVSGAEGGMRAWSDIRFDQDCTIDFGNQQNPSYFWTATASGLQALRFDGGFFNNGACSGNGYFIGDMESSTTIQFDGTINATKGPSIYTPNEIGKTQILKYLPQLRATMLTSKVVTTNLNLNVLPFDDSFKVPPSAFPLSTLGSNLLRFENDKLIVTPSVSKDYYVDAVDGSDTTGNGTEAKPYRTIQKALEPANQNPNYDITVYLKAAQEHFIDFERTRAWAVGVYCKKLKFTIYGNNLPEDDIQRFKLNTKLHIRCSNPAEGRKYVFASYSKDVIDVEFKYLNIKLNNLSNKIYLVLSGCMTDEYFTFKECKFETAGNHVALFGNDGYNAKQTGNSEKFIETKVRFQSDITNRTSLNDFFSGTGTIIYDTGLSTKIQFDTPLVKLISANFAALFPNVVINGKGYANDFFVNIPQNEALSSREIADIKAMLTNGPGTNAQQETKINNLNTQVSQLQNSLTTLQNKDVALENTLNGLTSRFNGYKPWIETKEYIDNKTQLIANINTQLASMKNWTESKRYIDDAVAPIAGLTSKFNQYKPWDETQTAITNSVNTAVTPLNTRLTDLSTQLSQLSNHVNGQSNFVKLTDNQSIRGEKIFQDNLTVQHGTNPQKTTFAVDGSGVLTTYTSNNNSRVSDVKYKADGIYHNDGKLLKESEFNNKFDSRFTDKLNEASRIPASNDFSSSRVNNRILKVDGNGNLRVGHRIYLANNGNAKVSIGVDSGNGGSLTLVNGADTTYVKVACKDNQWYFNEIVNVPDLLNRSDRRIKEDIVPIQNALEKIKAITGYHYTLKENGNRMEGFIAQEVQEVLPNSVNDSDVLSVRYNGVLALLLNAVKELDDKVNLILKGN